MVQTLQMNNTLLRDGHQSLAATRMSTEQMIPLLPILDKIGFHALESWGGATIDAAMRYLGENPFDRLRTLKKGTPHTKHMMLLRGQNIVQYSQFPDDVVELFVKCASQAGIDIFRIFDALNDIRNLKTAIKAVLACGKEAQGTVCYTTSPVHTLEFFAHFAKELEKEGCQSICIKDMAGLITPQAAYDLVKAIKKEVSVPLVLHSHNTAGLATASYYAATLAGVDIVDTSIFPFANGTAQPDALLIQEMLAFQERQPHYDEKLFKELQDLLKPIYKSLKGFTDIENETINVDSLAYQVPGGMLSNFRTQLKEQNMQDRFEEVMKEVVYVREALGWIPLVTPTSQIVGQQAVQNAKMGRWKMMSAATLDIILGRYGQTPAPVSSELLQKAIEQTKEQPITCRPADMLKPKVEILRAELKSKNLPTDDEAVVLYAMFPSLYEAICSPEKREKIKKTHLEQAQGETFPAKQKMRLTMNEKTFEVLIEDVK